MTSHNGKSYITWALSLIGKRMSNTYLHDFPSIEKVFVAQENTSFVFIHCINEHSMYEHHTNCIPRLIVCGSLSSRGFIEWRSYNFAELVKACAHLVSSMKSQRHGLSQIRFTPIKNIHERLIQIFIWSVSRFRCFCEEYRNQIRASDHVITARNDKRGYCRTYLTESLIITSWWSIRHCAQ